MQQILFTTGVGAGNFWGVQKIFFPNFPKFSRKTFMQQTFSINFSEAVGTFYFPLPWWHRLENRTSST